MTRISFLPIVLLHVFSIAQLGHQHQISHHPEEISIRFEDAGAVPVSEREERLLAAARFGESRIVKGLLDLGTNIKYRNADGDTALSLAAANKNEDIGILLVEAGANVNNVDKSTHTPLTYSAMYNLVRLARSLLDHGADVNKKGPYGGTPLHFAAGHNNIAVGELLVQRGADYHIKDNNGKTPLDVVKEAFGMIPGWMNLLS